MKMSNECLLKTFCSVYPKSFQKTKFVLNYGTSMAFKALTHRPRVKIPPYDKNPGDFSVKTEFSLEF